MSVLLHVHFSPLSSNLSSAILLLFSLFYVTYWKYNRNFLNTYYVRDILENFYIDYCIYFLATPWDKYCVNLHSAGESTCSQVQWEHGWKGTKANCNSGLQTPCSPDWTWLPLFYMYHSISPLSLPAITYTPAQWKKLPFRWQMMLSVRTLFH